MSTNTPFTMFGGQIVERHVQFKEQEGVVVFLDALGIKGVSKRMDPIKVLEGWDKVYCAFESAVNTRQDDQSLVSSTLPKINMQFSAFSDTVVITAGSKENLKQRPREFIKYVADIIMSPFLTAIPENFFFRGAISLGKFYQSNRMVIGPAVDEVAEYYKLPNWIGISTSQSASSVLNMSRNHLSEALIRYNIPYKNGKTEANGWALAWIKSDRPRFDKCMRILEQKQELLRREGNQDYVKYTNTINFCHYMSQEVN